eukprot:3318688-Pyramimonas_sp.AAC.1
MFYVAPHPACQKGAQTERKVVEIFAGSRRLAKALARRGIPCEGWDINDGSSCDLTRSGPQRGLLSGIHQHRYCHLHFARPCQTHSRARRPG